MAPEVESPPYPLYSTSFLLYKVSPLFIGADSFDGNSLRQYASQLRDILTGEVLRGVRVGLVGEDEALARAGALRNVLWRNLEAEEAWRPATDEGLPGSDDLAGFEENSVGILIQIIYEKETYSAILLRDREKEEDAGFAHYPLILTRMPTRLRQTFLRFLATSFDTRASLMKLSSQLLIETLEKYLSDMAASGDRASESVESIIKDVWITVSFEIPEGASLLKTIDINIPKDDVWPMITRGRRLQEIAQLAASSKSDRPFTVALSHYINSNLGLNLEDVHVNFSKIVCGAFAIGMDGRIKIFPPNVGGDTQGLATKALMEGLIKAARVRKR